MNTYTIKPSSTEDFYNAFTSHAIKISGEPSYDNIRQLRSTVYENASSVNASQGGGLHGHLGMVMDAATYATIAAAECTDPVEPPPIPNIPVGATGPQISEAYHIHAQALRERLEFQNLDRALMKQITEAIEPLYLKSFALPYIGLLELEANRNKLALPYDATSEPFQVLLKLFEEARKYAVDGNLPITDAQLINSGIVALKNTGVLDQIIDLWTDKPPEDRTTWLAFKLHFRSRILEYQKGRRNSNTGTPAYGLAAYGIDITIQEHQYDAMANMAATQAELFNQLATMHEKFAALIAATQHQRTAPMANTKVPVLPVQSPANVVPNRNASYKHSLLLNGNYCWSHGYRVRNSHTSATCTYPKKGHQIAATRANTMGGSTSGQAAVNAAIAEANTMES